MRLENAWIGNHGKIVTLPRTGPTGEDRSVKRWQVRWLLNVGPGMPLVERKTTTFTTKKKAEAFIEELDKAHYGSMALRCNAMLWVSLPILSLSWFKRILIFVLDN